MRIIDTKITKEILTGDNFPQLKIADKLYTVDNRQSTFDKVQELREKENITEAERTNKIYEITLGAEAAKEIKNLDLPVENAIYLSFCIMAAMTGEDPDELQKSAKENLRKN